MTERRVEDRRPAAQPSLQYLILDRLTQPQFVLAVASGGFLWWLANRLLGGDIPENARELVSALVGFISGQMVGPAWQFFLGTTQGSEKKTSALSDNAATLRQQGLLPEPGEPAAPSDPDFDIPPYPETQVGDMTVHADTAMVVSSDDPKAKT